MPPRPSQRPADRGPAPTARRIAYEVLTEHAGQRAASIEDRTGKPHITQLLDERLAGQRVAVPERRLATELVYGIARRRATLDALIAPFVARPREKIEDGLWRLLQLGAYQLVLLSGVPPHAAVSETVALAKQIGKPQWGGFINGVLRSLARELTDEIATTPSRRGAPLADGGALESPATVRYRLLAGEVFPDPAADHVSYLATAFSYPEWLIERWLRARDFDEALRLAAWFNSPGRMSLRVNPLRSSRDQMLAALRDRGVEAMAGEPDSAIRLPRPLRVEELPGYSDGWFSVQDESAQRAAEWLAPQPGEQVLDVCAAPGGKTTHLAELMQDRGRIVACDIHSSRLQRIAENVARLGLASTEMQLIEASGHDIPTGPFDAALVDVPCSNTGVLGKRPDARWRILPADLVELPALQRRLLLAAVDRVRQGGRVLYSTCSIDAAENQALVRTVLAENAGLSLVKEWQHVPGRPADGGYLALLVKA
jgi:16S rRNA (cytosine967-C5)-methyltransferase